MDALTVLVTGAGAPGIKGTLFSLRKNFDDRPIRVIGTDIREEVIGKYLCDSFHRISRPSDPRYLEQMLTICRDESVDVVLPQNTMELPVLARNRPSFSGIGTSVAVSDEAAIDTANDKFKLMEVAKGIGVPVPEFHLVTDAASLFERAKGLGWPDRPVVVKPPLSNGMRGVRIVDESIDLKRMFYEDKPTSLFIRMRNLLEVLGSEFPPLLVMEHLPGKEYTVDVIGGRRCTVVPRVRDVIHSGITFEGTVERNEEVIEHSRRLSEAVGLKYAFGFQFKMDGNMVPKLLESNPRVQGTMVLSTFAGVNVIYAAVKQALGEDVPELEAEWGTKILRYWGGVGVAGGKAKDLL